MDLLDDIDVSNRAELLSARVNEELGKGLLMEREIIGPMDRTVLVRDRNTGEISEKVMFGSNNYLGLANDPRVKNRVQKIIDETGTGLGGPPLLNGRTSLHIELERKLSDLKRMEDTMLFSSGYMANIGWITSLVRKKDLLVLDELAHASMIDGTRMMKGSCMKFPHNDIDGLRSALESSRNDQIRNRYVVVEGVYSMDGDIPPLPEIAELAKKNDAFLIVDDAHGTGVMGENGKGILEHFDMEGQVDLVMGTFSKALASTGGFLSGSKEMIDMLRFTSRPYIFSASPPPVHIAGVLAALEIIIEDNSLVSSLHHNRTYLLRRMDELGLSIKTPSAIIPLYISPDLDFRKISGHFSDSGLFMNSIQYPAVAPDKQRFRISLMATHTRLDMDLLIDSIMSSGIITGGDEQQVVNQ